MTNNDELWEKLEAAESDELALNGNEVSNQLRHLADNEIDSDSFAVVNENYNGSEVEFERPITDLAIDAAEVIDALLAERDADKKRIAELEAMTVNIGVGCESCGGNGLVAIDHGELGVEHMVCPKCAAAGIKLEVGE